MTRPHVLIIRAVDDGELDFKLVCPYPANDTDKACTLLMECRHATGDDDPLAKPCPESPVGEHRLMAEGGMGSVQHGCWLLHGEIYDGVNYLQLDPGVYLLDARSDEFGYAQFTVREFVDRFEEAAA